MLAAPREIQINRILAVERTAYALGAALLLIWAAATAKSRLLAADALQDFDRAAAVDRSSWSPERVKAYEEARSSSGPAAIAMLTIPRLHLTVPVLEGVDAPILDRGAGHIPDTASPGDAGNIGIAAHRDGFFRSLKDVRVGDELDLETPTTRMTYVVEKTWIVEPEDLTVLAATPSPAVTLVTCYPFYYVGAAPRRFIVRAVGAPPKERP
jgi:sortase A